ncbi:succinate dehydrogenase cytochrome b subunit [Flaviaesturariibacter aridisoli]|uniref:Succinate dehydrogenase cytochrome b subunit n=1 Tax=Flaviaesturariibacter aridisoli TaxID=2545761 RepID=A0A4R4DZQ9_9BACT|nr:succinate dehydrogenase cytochrome b subunit [Flaviaesturariibacter aridisoli]TCZ68095.1 succinate dehydrogenase cytochrome b subunit [Flaviaesturariibacter aridisoli]
MKWSHFFTSAVGRKFVMALTGIFLISFLLIHVALNACLFNDLTFFNANDNGSMFNRAAHFMGNSIVIRILEFGLFAGFLLHIVQGYAVELKNRSRRSQGYQVSLGNRGSKWYSRSMALLGTLILLFLVVHIAQFWYPSRLAPGMLQEASYRNDTVHVHNLFLRMYEVFQQEWVVILYLLGVGALTFHLFQGFHSAWRSLGVHNRKYLAMLRSLGYVFTIVVCVLFALMPIAMYFQWVNPYN